MSTSQGVNVLRYSALIFGVFYGFTHKRTVVTNAETAKAQAEYKHKESLIEKAKAEWAKKNLPASAKTEGGDIISDPMDKNFDLEAYLQMVSAQNS